MTPDKNGLVQKTVEFEDDPSVIAEVEEKLNTALHILSMQVDPAFSFILYRFNRVGIKHAKVDAILYLDKNGTPTIGINYAKFNKLTPLAQISVIEHQVGHIMSGHLGDRLGHELRQYCEYKYGPKMGAKVYYLTIEAIADMFVSYPGTLKDNGRPYYDIRKLGLPKWEYTLNAMRRIEELLDLDSQATWNGEDDPKQNSLADQLSDKMRKSSQWQKSDSPSKKDQGAGNVKSLTDDGDLEEQSEDEGDEESGGVQVKDYIFVPDKRDAMMAEERTREIIQEALKNSEKSRGYMSGDAGQYIEAARKPPVVPWYQRLNHVISSGISYERRITKKRINRRNPDYGFGRVHQNVTSICFVIDTSGSMGDDDLKHVDAELASIVQNTEEPVNVIHCDAGVAKCELYRHGMKMQQFWGRGGTSFEPALEYIKKELPDMPDLIVYFTDGYGGRINDANPIIHPSEADILWILTPHGMSERSFRSQITNQGDVIKVEEWT